MVYALCSDETTCAAAAAALRRNASLLEGLAADDAERVTADALERVAARSLALRLDGRDPLPAAPRQPSTPCAFDAAAPVALPPWAGGQIAFEAHPERARS